MVAFSGGADGPSCGAFKQCHLVRVSYGAVGDIAHIAAAVNIHTIAIGIHLKVIDGEIINPGSHNAHYTHTVS